MNLKNQEIKRLPKAKILSLLLIIIRNTIEILNASINDIKGT